MTVNLRTSFEGDGYVFCKSFVDVQEILQNLDRFVREVVPGMPPELVFFEDKSQADSLKQLQLLHENDAFFRQLANGGPFRELAELLLGESVVCKNMQYFNKPPQIGQPTPAHQDGFYFKLDPPQALTMWLALDDVDEENGCVRYVPGSHLQGMRDHGSTGTLGFSQGITDFPSAKDLQNEVAFPAQPGDLLAHHALTIHRADGNRSETRTRRALGFIYYGESAKLDVQAYEKYQRELKEKLQRENKI